MAVRTVFSRSSIIGTTMVAKELRTDGSSF